MARSAKSGKFLAFCFLGFLEIFAQAQGDVISCGGVLSGAKGAAEFTADPADTPKRNNCIWILQTSKGSAIQFKLVDIAQNASLSVHSYESVLSITLSTANISSTVTTLGREIIAVLPYKLGTKVSFEWEAVEDSEDENEEGDNYSFYSSSTAGGRAVQLPQSTGTVIGAVSLESIYNMNVSYTIEFSGPDPTNYFNTRFYAVFPTGSFGSLDSFDVDGGGGIGKKRSYEFSEIVVWGKFNVANGTEVKFSLEWAGDVPPVTATTPAPGLATNLYASKILAFGLMLQAIISLAKALN